MKIVVKINVKGPIIDNSQKSMYDWFEIEATCPKDITDNIPTNGEEIELIINSPGGIVDAGSEIYTALREYEGEVTAKIVGMAASAASVIIMAATKIKISPTARIMIHNGQRRAEGDHRDMGSAAESIIAANKAIRNAYMAKTKLSEEELTTLMDKETTMDAKSAVEKGFADEIMFQEDSMQLVASVGSGLLSSGTIAKIRTIMAKEKEEKPDDNLEAINQMKNELLLEEIQNSLN